MTLTRRGLALAAVVVLSLGQAALYGPRSLNAVVAPGVVALGVAVLYVRRIDQPELERVAPDDGFASERRTVRLELSADSSFTGRLVDRVDEGLTAEDNDRTTTVGEGTITYEVTYRRRGRHTIGPSSITARDVLGLAEKTFTYHNEHEVLVYPRVHDLTGRARHELNLLPEFREISMRNEFDSLREYERGDSLRDVHWKTSAKRPDEDLFVKEYTAEDDLGSLSVVAEAASSREAADAMAEAAASVISFLLAAGLTVGLSTPEGVLDPGEGRIQRQRMLELLARTGPGRVPESERADADVVVSADRAGSATIRIDGRELPFERLRGTGQPDDIDPWSPSEAVTAGADQ